MSKRTWIIFAVIVIGILGALVATSRGSHVNIDVSSVDSNSIQKASTQNGNIAEHIFGKTDSKVVLVEYGDFQCPGCGSAYPGIKKVTEEYKDSIAFVFRNFPLPATTHPNAKSAAATVESAGLQGKYREMFDKVYSSQQEWQGLSGTARTDMFVSYAKAIGLDEAKFKDDLGGTVVTQKIAFDKAIGEKIGVNSTPTFYLNGQKIDSTTIQDIQSGNGGKLRTLINAELKKAGITAPSATE